MRRSMLPATVVVVLAFLAAGCTDSERSGETGTEAGSTTPATSSVAVYLLRDGKVSPVRRAIDATPALARAALTSLLAGPTDAETTAGLSSAIARVTSLRDISLAGGTATVDLDATFGEGTTPTLRQRVAQVVATLTRFPTIRRVAFRLDGEPVETIGAGKVRLSPALGRRQIEAQTPQILVESPLPGDRVTSPIRVRGTANVFEATVSFEVRDEGENVVQRSFTTATSGTGTRGTFETRLSVPDLEGLVTIVAFEASAEDGSPLHVAEVPVHVAG
jgi:immunoglobulin-like protein involved in spore germination/sporulation and spore germination protein